MNTQADLALWNVIKVNTEEREFGNSYIREYGGLPPDMYLSSIAGDHALAMAAAYSQHHHIYLLSRVWLDENRLDSDDPEPKFFQKHCAETLALPTMTARYHAHAAFLGKFNISTLLELARDDIVMHCETDTDFYMLWFDSTMRSDALRLRKETIYGLTLEQFSQAHLANLHNTKNHWQHGTDDPAKDVDSLIVRVPFKKT